MIYPSPLADKSFRFIQVDDEGYFMVDELRVADLEIGHKMIAHVQMDERNRPFTFFGDEPALIEAFDEPYVALSTQKGPLPATEPNAPSRPQSPDLWTLTTPYRHREEFDLSSLTLDEWDRFHGHTVRGVPFVMSRSCQADFFNQLDEFDDDSITVGGQRFEIKPWLADNADVERPQWWTDLYVNQQARWELDAPSHVLATRVPQLKLQKSRVLVPCCGSGNDAAWFAEQGHLVTGVDFSDEALDRARRKYGHLPNLKFVKADIFQLPVDMNQTFDLVFEQTCYCAIAPSRRKDLIKLWRRMLVDHGHIMGVFFAMDKSFGPPYGGSEWEIRQRLEKGNFRLLYWNRLRDSIPTRLGHELFLYAQKVPNFSAVS